MVQGVHRKLRVSNSNGRILSQFFPFFPKTGHVMKPNNGCPENYCISLGCEWAPVEVETGFTWSAAGGERGAVKLFHILQTGVLAITGCSLGVLVEQSSSVFNVVIFFYPIKTLLLTQIISTPPENPLYERGEDNKLIIWTPGHSGTLTRSSETAAPRLPYQRLLTRTSSSTPDSATGVRPVSSPVMETYFPYQKLIRATTSLPRTAGSSSSYPDCANVVSPAKFAQVEEEVFPYQELFKSTPSLKGEAPWLECGQKRVSEAKSNDDGVSVEPYQCLSLQKNQPVRCSRDQTQILRTVNL